MPTPAPPPLIWGLFANGGQVIQALAAGISAVGGTCGTIFGFIGFLRATPATHRGRVAGGFAAGGALLALFGVWWALWVFLPAARLWATPAAVIVALAVTTAYGRFGLRTTGPEKVTVVAGGRLKIVNTRVVNADHMPKVEYKRKLYIVVQNTSDVELLIGPGTAWKAGDLKIREIPQQVWEEAPPNGWHADQWTHKEHAEIRLKPGQSARTWVGLHPAATQEEFDALSTRAGALLVPVKVLGEVRERLQL